MALRRSAISGEGMARRLRALPEDGGLWSGAKPNLNSAVAQVLEIEEENEIQPCL
jgi:hypothetical protein